MKEDVLKILTEKKHLHLAVDENIRKGMAHDKAFDEVITRVHGEVPGIKVHYLNAASYWASRNRETRNRKMFRK